MIRRHSAIFLCSVAILVCPCCCCSGKNKPRARDLGVPFDGTPTQQRHHRRRRRSRRPHTLISGEGKLQSQRPVRTGVTAVLPRGKKFHDRSRLRRMVFAKRKRRNDRHHMGRRIRIPRSPVMITNTHSVGVVRDAVIQWRSTTVSPIHRLLWSLPVVAETWTAAQRHQRLPREARTCVSRNRHGTFRAVEEGSVVAAPE